MTPFLFSVTFYAGWCSSLLFVYTYQRFLRRRKEKSDVGSPGI